MFKSVANKIAAIQKENCSKNDFLENQIKILMKGFVCIYSVHGGHYVGSFWGRIEIWCTFLEYDWDELG